MHMLASGKSIGHVEKKTGIDHKILSRLWKKYQAGGEIALLNERSPRKSYEEKLVIVRDLVEKGLSLMAVSIRYDVSVMSLMRWRRSYMKDGPEGLISKKNQMAKKERTKAEMDELEMLRKRNEYLEAENALLKKVRALVEEREARLRAIGQKPSKN